VSERIEEKQEKRTLQTDYKQRGVQIRPKDPRGARPLISLEIFLSSRGLCARVRLCVICQLGEGLKINKIRRGERLQESRVSAALHRGRVFFTSVSFAGPTDSLANSIAKTVDAAIATPESQLWYVMSSRSGYQRYGSPFLLPTHLNRLTSGACL